MGKGYSCIKISRSHGGNEFEDSDLQYLLENTHFNEKEIKEWYESFIVRRFSLFFIKYFC